MKRILNKVASYFKFIRDRKNNLNELEMTLVKEAFCGHENDEKNHTSVIFISGQ